MSAVYDCTQPDGLEAGLDAAFNAVRDGRLVVLPTDTVYGIGCDAFNGDAVSDLLKAKGRGPDMPVPVLIGSWHTVDGLVLTMTEQIQSLIRAFWPGGLSIVAEQAPSLSWKLGNTAGTVMLRMPMQPTAIELLRRTGPMAVSSANKTGNPPAQTIDQAQFQLEDLVSVYLDAGPSEIGVASSIVDVSVGRPRLLREGALSADTIAEVLDMDVSELRRSL